MDIEMITTKDIVAIAATDAKIPTS